MSKTIMRYLPAIIALLAIASSAMAQELTLQSSESGLVVNANGLTSMTALQFTLELPEGVTIANDASMGEATDGHTLCMETLRNGNRLFILYSMNLNTFKDGELLHIPLDINNDGTAKLYNVRFADTAAISYAGAETATGINLTPAFSKRVGAIYDLCGRRVTHTGKGIYIIDGKKVVK